MAQPPSENEYELGEDGPWLDLGFDTQLSRDRILELKRSSGGDLYATKESGLTVWYRWTLFEANNRRRGAFSIGGGQTSWTVRAYVDAVHGFDALEYQHMASTIAARLPGFTWDVERLGSGVRADRRVGHGAIAELIERVQQELRDAEAIARFPIQELTLATPHQRVFGSHRVCATDALPENHMLGWWAAHRSRDLQRARREIDQELIARRSTRAAQSAITSRARLDAMDREISSAEAHSRELQSLEQRVMPRIRFEAPRWSSVGPGMTRDPRRRRLLEALRSSVDVAEIIEGPIRSTFQEKPLSSLFELWGAIAVVETAQALGWVCIGEPRVRKLLPWSLERATWTLVRSDETLDVVFEPHVEQVPLRPQPPEGPHRLRVQRANVPPGPARLVSVGAEPSPDYALILKSSSGVAFAIGDAIASDLQFLRENPSKNRVNEKLSKVADRYAREILWSESDRYVRCSVPASFVLVPGMVEDWHATASIGECLERVDVMLLAGRPRPDGGIPIARERLACILDTLRAHIVDRSQLVPKEPGMRAGGIN
jgi:hypothetical protein